MFATVHAVAGAIVGLRARRSSDAFAVGFGSHLAIDSVPHFGWAEPSDEKFLKVAYPDVALASAVSAVLLAAAPADRRRSVAAGIAGSIAPDAGKATRHFLGTTLYPAWFNRFHFRIQEGRESPRGLWVELGTVAALALVYRSAVAKWAARGSNPAHPDEKARCGAR